MFRIITFRSDAAFWPLAERSDFEAGSHGSGGLLGKVTALVQGFKAERAARRAMHELQSLDDRTLKDIGISRDQIWHVVRHGREAMLGEALDIARWS